MDQEEIDAMIEKVAVHGMDFETIKSELGWTQITIDMMYKCYMQQLKLRRVPTAPRITETMQS